MYHLVYTSKATQEMDDDDLIEILETSRRNNTRRGITGILLHRDGRFLQVLEGSKGIVEEVYEIIKEDERHTNVQVVMEGYIPEREFGEWEMGFEDIGELDAQEIEGISLFLEGTFTPEQARRNRSKVEAFLQVFRGIAAV